MTLLEDDRGSVVGVVNPSQGSNLGEIVEKLHYNMTGLCRAYAYNGTNDTEKFRADDGTYNLGRSEKVPFGYLGMYHDPFTGLYHTHFREYDAVHGRWLSEDPAGYADGLNLYQAYMGVNGTDPLGLGNYTPEQMERMLRDPEGTPDEEVHKDDYLYAVDDLMKFREGRMLLGLYLSYGSKYLEHYSPGAQKLGVALDEATFGSDGNLNFGFAAPTVGEVKSAIRTAEMRDYATNVRVPALVREFRNQSIMFLLSMGSTQLAGFLLRDMLSGATECAGAFLSGPGDEIISSTADDVARGVANSVDDNLKGVLNAIDSKSPSPPSITVDSLWGKISVPPDPIKGGIPDEILGPYTKVKITTEKTTALLPSKGGTGPLRWQVMSRANGSNGSWPTARAGYWMKNTGSPTAPRHPIYDVPKELHHINGRNIPNPHDPSNLIEVWPWEHADIDPFRYYNGLRP